MIFIMAYRHRPSIFGLNLLDMVLLTCSTSPEHSHCSRQPTTQCIHIEVISIDCVVVMHMSEAMRLTGEELNQKSLNGDADGSENGR